MSDPKAVAADFLATFSTGNVDAVLDRMADGATWWVYGAIDGLSGTYGKAEFGGLLRGAVAMYREGALRLTPTHMIADGNEVAVEAESFATMANGRIYSNRYHFLFEVADVVPEEVDGPRPQVSFSHEGERKVIQADFIAGCDGFHGVCRDAIPAGVLAFFDKEYPFGWLGVLAAVAPSSEELIYSSNARGFALHSMRSPALSRFYLQVAPDEDIANWPDDRIWTELAARLETVPGWSLSTGPVVEKGITAMRSFVAEPMQYGRLYLAGDAAHIVPPTGAKGLNLAAFDVTVLTEALAAWYASGEEALLDAYSQTCLRRVWRAQHFSWWMTPLLHSFDSYDAYDRRLQESYRDYVCTSDAAATSLAENYVGLGRYRAAGTA